MAPHGPYKLRTVNTHPERAKLIVGLFVEAMKESYTIFHAEKAAKIEDVKVMCERNNSDVVVPLFDFLCNTPLLNDPASVLAMSKEHILTLAFVKFCASIWSEDESNEIQKLARETVPNIKTMAISQGLQAERGPEGVVDYSKPKWPSLVEE